MKEIAGLKTTIEILDTIAEKHRKRRDILITQQSYNESLCEAYAACAVNECISAIYDEIHKRTGF